jgi:hypothetical protein
MTSVCATQPTYFPHLHLLARAMSSDTLVLLGEAQFTRKTQTSHGAFPTRQASCTIVAKNGPIELTVPVHKGRNKIDDTEVVLDGWIKRQRLAVRHAYGQAPHGAEVIDDVDDLLDVFGSFGGTLGQLDRFTWLWALGRLAGMTDRRHMASQHLVAKACSAVCQLSRIERDIDVQPAHVDRGSAWMLAIARSVGADEYVAGVTAATNYLEPQMFEAAGVTIRVHSFAPRPYAQRTRTFEPDVSILDLAANVGWTSARDVLLARAPATT